MFEAPARIAFKCSACGLKLAELEKGARLAGLITIVVAALLISAAIALDIAVRPPLWLHAVIWIPLTIGGVIGSLRLFKVTMLYSSYEHRRTDISEE
ncbi:MAG: DUF983 domain-containing protein [Pseudomonadota bacterium]